MGAVNGRTRRGTVSGLIPSIVDGIQQTMGDFVAGASQVDKARDFRVSASIVNFAAELCRYADAWRGTRPFSGGQIEPRLFGDLRHRPSGTLDWAIVQKV